MYRILRRLQGLPLVAAALMLIGGAMAGKVIEEKWAWKTVVAGAVVFALGTVLQNWKPSAKSAGFRSSGFQKQIAPRRSILIQFLSVSSILPEGMSLTHRLDDDLARLAERKRDAWQKSKQQAQSGRQSFWAWEQTLRGIYHNHVGNGPLVQVILIASPKTISLAKPFYEQVICQYPDLIRDIQFQLYLRSENTLRTLSRGCDPFAESDGVDFENFEEISRALENIFRILERTTPREELELNVQIDLTGGQKPTSLVAGAMTILNDMTNQYVSTNPVDFDADKWTYDVIGYDIYKRMKD